MYLVTGGAGFIGSHLVERLVREGAPVRVLDSLATGSPDNLGTVRDRIEFVEGDVRNPDDIQAASRGVDVVFHQAAISSVQRSIEDPRTTLDVNLTGTLNVLMAALHSGCRRVVFASSAAVYGDSPDPVKTESMTPRPLSPYAISKLASEQLCAVYTSVHGLETVSLRYFNVFGPRQDPGSSYSGVIARFGEAIRTGSTPTIYWDGEQTRDFVHVSNVVEANLKAAKGDGVAGEVFNIGSGESTSLNALLALMAELAGTEVNATYEPARAGDIRDSVADIENARIALEFAVRVELSVGLTEMVCAKGRR